LECKENYILSQNNCVYKPYFDPHCKQFVSNYKCSVCKFNHYFKENQCYPCLTDPFRCLFCDPENPSKCLVCRSGTFMDESMQCLKVPNFTQSMIRLHQENQSSKFAFVLWIDLIYVCVMIFALFV
jgi:hypothetical protein